MLIISWQFLALISVAVTIAAVVQALRFYRIGRDARELARRTIDASDRAIHEVNDLTRQLLEVKRDKLRADTYAALLEGQITEAAAGWTNALLRLRMLAMWCSRLAHHVPDARIVDAFNRELEEQVRAFDVEAEARARAAGELPKPPDSEPRPPVPVPVKPSNLIH